MKVLTHTSMTRPGILLLDPELSDLSSHYRQFCPWSQTQILTQNKNGMINRIQSSVSKRIYAPVTLSPTESVTTQSSKKAGHTRIYEFLQRLGIVPDVLDGMELPASISVMRERVDFLHKLGLMIEDINNYPFVLGCSVQKNMIPVLDYLGKLGVRKLTLTEFLHQYPQVLRSSIVVDLQPVVKYLLGMDIQPNDIPRVLERYPEVLAFKLEGTMSTSVAYLVGIGVTSREIGVVLTRYPDILGMRVGRVIKPFVEFLGSIGIPRLAVARLIERRPHILGFRLEEQVKPNVDILLEYGVRSESLASVIALYPEIVGIELKPKLLSQRSLFSSSLDMDHEDFGRVVEKMPQVVSVTQASVLKHIDFLKDWGFSLEQVQKMVTGCPQLLALNLDIMKMSFNYYQREMCRDLDDLVAFPAFFTYGLESTIKPRYCFVAKKGLKWSLAWLLNCTNEKFEERMSYDSINVQEMEMGPSFDMKSLFEPRRDESASEDDDRDDEYL